MIVIPMAGLSSRFFKAGFNKPKYMLEAHGKTLFEHSVGSFKHYFDTERFLFIVRDLYNTPLFVEQQSKSLGIKDYEIVVLTEETRGQAETVALGLKTAKNYKDSITIFNIDTFRPNFRYPLVKLMGDGYLEVFRGTGDNWSFVKQLDKNSNKVIKTTEKDPISDLCCTGLYYFRNINDYFESYVAYLQKPKASWEKGELYVAPLYNHLISSGKDIRFNIISNDEVIFCGVPDEYTTFLNFKDSYTLSF